MNKLIKLLPHKIRYSKMLEELEETYNREFKLRKRYGVKEFYLDLITSIEDRSVAYYKLDNMKFKTIIKADFIEDGKTLEFIKDVVVSDIGYSGDYGRILGIAMTLKEKLTDDEIPELR